jgi:hypothetical protein
MRPRRRLLPRWCWPSCVETFGRAAEAHERVAGMHERAAAAGIGDVGVHERQVALHRAAAAADRLRAGRAQSVVSGPHRAGPAAVGDGQATAWPDSGTGLPGSGRAGNGRGARVVHAGRVDGKQTAAAGVGALAPGHERDRAADERERVADERERLARDREREADERERKASEREALADDRERGADERERTADGREAELTGRQRKIDKRERELDERRQAMGEACRLWSRARWRLSAGRVPCWP